MTNRPMTPVGMMWLAAIHSLTESAAEINPTAKSADDLESQTLEQLVNARNGRLPDCPDNSRPGKRTVVGPIRIIAMTAAAMQRDCENYLHSRMDDYISKPVKNQDIKKFLQGNFPDRFGRNPAATRAVMGTLTALDTI